MLAHTWNRNLFFRQPRSVKNRVTLLKSRCGLFLRNSRDGSKKLHLPVKEPDLTSASLFLQSREELLVVDFLDQRCIHEIRNSHSLELWNGFLQVLNARLNCVFSRIRLCRNRLEKLHSVREIQEFWIIHAHIFSQYLINKFSIFSSGRNRFAVCHEECLEPRS